MDGYILFLLWVPLSLYKWRATLSYSGKDKNFADFSALNCGFSDFNDLFFQEQSQFCSRNQQ